MTDKYCPHIEHSELCVRYKNAMRHLKLDTFEQLAKLTERDLLQLKSCGPATVREVRRALRFRGLDLKASCVPGIAECGLPLPPDGEPTP